jgi:hypothetical protein
MSARRRSGRRGHPRWPWLAGVAGLAALALLLGWAGVRGVAAPAAAPGALASADGGAPAAPRETVKLIFQTVPPMKAEVRWGKKVLGIIKGPRKPFILERPRDSGPLDITIKAEGQIPVHTRAYTFTDSRVMVKVTPTAEKSKIFGYRQEVPDGGVDGGGPIPNAFPAPAQPFGPGLVPAAQRPDAGAPLGPIAPPAR